MGPAYSFMDHFQYFDVDILICWLNAPQVWLTLPSNVSPLGVIPPLPTKITNFLGASIGSVSDLLGGLVGR